MIKYSSKSFHFITIVLLSSLCLLLDHFTQIQYRSRHVSGNILTYIIKDVSAKIYDKYGHMRYSINSSRILSHGENNTTLDNIDIAIHYANSDKIHYAITAQNATINHELTKIILHDNTTIQVFDEHDNITTLFGNNINLDMAHNTLYSESQIHINNSHINMTGSKFTYDIQRDVVYVQSIKATLK